MPVIVSLGVVKSYVLYTNNYTIWEKMISTYEKYLGLKEEKLHY